MKRRLFTILSALSLLVCFACSLMWLRSGFALDFLSKDDGSRLLSSATGMLEYTTVTYTPPMHPTAGRWGYVSMSGSAWSGSSRPVWNWQWLPDSSSSSHTVAGHVYATRKIRLPYWIPIFLTALLPLLMLGRWTRTRWQSIRRQRAGLCPNCGYDLRASKERCPECGTPIPAHQTARGSVNEQGDSA